MIRMANKKQIKNSNKPCMLKSALVFEYYNSYRITHFTIHMYRLWEVLKNKKKATLTLLSMSEQGG